MYHEKQMTQDETNVNPEQQEETTTAAHEDMEAKIKNLEEVAKKAQYDYVMLKYDFDSYQRRVEQEGKEQKSKSIVDIMKKILPIIDQLSYSVEHMPEEMQGNTRADGVKLIYDNAMKTLAGLGIEKIATIGQEPDSDLHEPLSVEPAADESMKGKIIKEYEAGYTLSQ